MKTNGDTTIAASAEKVWEIFAHDFENAYKWMSSVNHSYGKINGEKFEGALSQGRVCELSNDPNGMRASESFLAYDEASRSATVRIEIQGGPAVVPIKVNIMDIVVASTGENSARVSMTIRSELKPFGYLLYPLVKIGLKSFIKQIQEELKYYAENNAPHPRKVNALQKRAGKLGKKAANA
jgi:carbon monoxide dehydrogenase subunit G